MTSQQITRATTSILTTRTSMIRATFSFSQPIVILTLLLLVIMTKMSDVVTGSTHVYADSRSSLLSSLLQQQQQQQQQHQDQQQFIYHGVPSTCQISQTYAQLKSNVPITWCQYQNSFASRQQFLSDIDLFRIREVGDITPAQAPTPTPTTTIRPFLCDNTTDLCTSYIAIRSHDAALSEFTKEHTGNYLVMALVTGEVYLFNSNSGLISEIAARFDSLALSNNNNNNYEDVGEKEQRIKFETIDVGTWASIVQVTEKDLQYYYLETFKRIQLRYSRHKLFFDRGLRVVDMKLIGSSTNPIAAVLLVPFNQPTTVRHATLSFVSFASDIQQIANWNIVYELTTTLNMYMFEHFGGFDPSGPMYFSQNRFKETEYQKRQLIALYTTQSVSIYQVDLLSIHDMDIDLTHATRQSRLKSLFYETSQGYEITALSVTVDPIRHPVSITEATSCSNVRYDPSLAVYLNIAESHPNIGARLTVHNVPEFSSFSFTKKEDLTNNPCDRSPTFNCSPGEYLASRGQMCKRPVERTINLDSRVILLQSAFTDITLNGELMDPYWKDGQLNPLNLCEAFHQYPMSGQNLTVSDCKHIVTSEVKCEVDMLMTNELEPYLDSFFYLYWKEHIYLAQEDNIISIISRTSFYDEHNIKDFTLSEANKLQSVGPIRDIHVSKNGQHLFSSVYRNRWEIDSNDRYIEICQKLKEDPENVFLKPFANYCTSMPPRSITSKDFALVSSSCNEGFFCPNFDSAVLKDAQPGRYVYRSFLELECPEGSYCPGNGRRLNCPLGFICPQAGLSRPVSCPLPSSKSGQLQQTCFQENLKKPAITPTGTWATTTIFPPVLIPPGKYLLKVTDPTGDLKIAGVRDCLIGDYCNLGREIIANESESHDHKDLLCPELTFCRDPKVIEPTACVIPGSPKMPYCPAGTYQNSTCPAGYYCPSPKEKYPCATTQYCPAGSFLSLVCPAGYYCPSPDVKKLCPHGYYCVAGSTYPQRCSFFFGNCSEGSINNSLIASGVIVTILLICCIGLGYIIFLVYISCHRRRGDRIRSQKNEVLTEVLFDSKKQIKQQSKCSLQPHQPVDTESEYQEIEQMKPLLLVKAQEVVTKKVTIELHKPDYFIDLKFEDLGLTLPSNNQIILHGVTGEIEHGKLTAVMGVSGAGKSTFISTLAGRAYYGKQMGRIYVNGEEVLNLDKFSGRIGFVPQDDIMIRECTVEETLYFSARTRLDRRKSKREIMDIVDNVIHVLRLDHVRHSIIGDESTRGISGGERKRVSVGIELVAQPIVLFCDEPTSGLDSASSKEVCEALLSIARSGITVVSVIHQPRYECFEMFENLLLLGQGGRTVYMGEVSNVQSYFESLGYHFPVKVNPADYLMDITSGNVEPAAYASIGNQQSISVCTENLPLLWQDFSLERMKLTTYPSNNKINSHMGSINEGYSSELKLPVYEGPRRSYVSHFIMCFERSLVQQIRHIGSICLDSFLVGLSAFFVGMLFFKDEYRGPVPPEIYNQCPPELREGCKSPRSDPIFTLSNTIGMCIALCGVMGGLRVFGREKVVFRKESQTGLSTFFYFWAKDISMLPSVILSPAIFVAIFYSIVVPRAPAIYYFYSILLTYWSCFGLGYVISILFSPHIAQLAAVVVVFILNIFSGISPRLTAFASMYFPMRYMPFLSILRYSMELTYVNELWFYRKVYDIRRSLTGTGYHFYDAAFCCGMLVALGFGLRFLAYVMLLSSKPNSLLFNCYHRANAYASSASNYFQERLYSFCAKVKQFLVWRV